MRRRRISRTIPCRSAALAAFTPSSWLSSTPSSPCAAATPEDDFASASNSLSAPKPVYERWMRVTGAITSEFGSAKPVELCGARIPTTVNGVPSTEIDSPSADPVGYSSVASVDPMTATFAALVTSDAVNALPLATVARSRP